MANKATGDNSAPNQEQDSDESANINETINRAITARLRSFSEKIDSMLEEKLSKLQPVDKEEKSKKSTASPDPEVEAIQNELKALQNERKANRDMSLRATVKEKLLQAGVNPSAVKALVALHVDSEKTISYASDGSNEILFRDHDSHHTLDHGISNWLKSDEAKIYLTPKGHKGAGFTSTKNSSQNNQQKPESAAVALIDYLYGSPSNQADDD